MTNFTDAKPIFLGVIAVLYVIGVLFMRNTHPYRGSRNEPFESKQQRRRIGVFFLCSATLVVGIGVLVQYLINKN